MMSYFEEKLNQEADEELMSRLDSLFCGLGYRSEEINKEELKRLLETTDPIKIRDLVQIIKETLFSNSQEFNRREKKEAFYQKIKHIKE